MIQYFSIIQIIIIINLFIQLYINSNSNNFKIVFNYLILPLIFYSAIGHLVFTNKVAKSIGWKTSPFQLELGYFTLSLFIIGLYASVKNYSIETMKSIAYIWVLFIIMASINHIKEILFDKNYSFNNIYPIFITIITSGIVFYYS